MAYLLDTNIFRELLEHFPKRGKMFEEIWRQFEQGIKDGSILSVDECYNELTRHYDEKNPHYQWLHDRQEMFLNPTNEESIYIRTLFQNPKMRESIHEKNIVKNRPAADAYLAAKAKALGAVVVTKEEYKPHSAQLPNVCEALGVKWISYDEFMEELSAGAGW